MPTAVRSHAKINLGLHIGAPRADGFHALVTVYQTLELFDLVTVSARPAAKTALRLTSNDGRVPTDGRNTAWKMVELALRILGKTAEVEIHIEKRLPVQGGLGAGSANAVAALVGLDRGQEVYPLPDIEPTWCVVATPAVGVSTPQAFRDWDALCAQEGLTQDASHGKLSELSRAYASAFAGGFPRGEQGAGSSGVLPYGENLAGPQVSALVRTGISSWIQNDFERVVFVQHPSLAEIKRILAAPGTPAAALHASLSGSGSALYGLYLTRGDALAACERLRLSGVVCQLTRTLPRPAYWSEMLEEEGH